MATEPVRRRRHGKQLEAELLAAAWDELIETGYARLTMESIAVRARTSEAVLYRRWAHKDEVVMAALEHYRATHRVAIPDTGTLRGDLLAELAAVSETRATFFAIAAATAYSGLLAGTGLTPAQVRTRVLGEAARPGERALYRRAHDRGELDLERVSVTLLEMPFDLVRHDLLMELKTPSPARIRAIVDDLFLPLLERR
ncbi:MULTISPECIES: TetR/AcrR family transcriptional regulator [unclassified Amycolatopsis]|uniref:TetR/AcrR family transcriptional regulator n=1 Tax=unclassified Amycolatopsis TaxID=2618356 RepID=UPI001FF6253B|nr:TetR/AcrR family transcriptional regulator [Amycolatopsis sp. FBCC-B4732]UOX92918.1 TetR/AcrR family transcriptional regulator [Amycolatopsis sp. FBCC-B4732]